MALAACASHVRRRLLHPGAGAPARSLYAQSHQAKVGVAEFLNGAGKAVETQAAELEEAVDGGDTQKVLETRTRRRKKLGYHWKLRKLILSYPHKYGLGLWKPPAETRKVQ